MAVTAAPATLRKISRSLRDPRGCSVAATTAVWADQEKSEEPVGEEVWTAVLIALWL